MELRAGRRAACAALALWTLTGCAERAWDVATLEQRFPALRRQAPHRLADVRPYYLPLGGELLLFLCRWPDGARVPVHVDPRATADERRRLEAALDAWQALLPLHFEVGPASGVGIEIRLLDDMLAYSANTVADCAVEAEGLAEGLGQRLPARLVSASIHLARGDPRLAGTALHELGHALGFQGHARRGPSAMVGSTDAIRRAGERVLAGKPLRDAAVEALYAVPSGTLLRRRALPSGRTRAVDRLLARGRAEGWIGPLVRVGDHEGLVSWYDSSDRRLSVELEGLRQALREPARLTLVPSERARTALGEGP